MSSHALGFSALSTRRAQLTTQISRSEGFIKISLVFAIVYWTLSAVLPMYNCIGKWEELFFYGAGAAFILGALSLAWQRQNLVKQLKNTPLPKVEKPSRAHLLEKACVNKNLAAITQYLPDSHQSMTRQELGVWHRIFDDLVTTGNREEMELATSILENGLISDSGLLGRCLKQCLKNQTFSMIKILLTYKTAPRFEGDCIFLEDLPVRTDNPDAWFDIYQFSQRTCSSLATSLIYSSLMGLPNYISLLTQHNREEFWVEFNRLLGSPIKISPEDVDRLITTSTITSGHAWRTILVSAMENNRFNLVSAILLHHKISDAGLIQEVLEILVKSNRLDMIQALLHPRASPAVKQKILIPHYISVTGHAEWQTIFNLCIDRGYYRLAISITEKVRISTSLVLHRLAAVKGNEEAFACAYYFFFNLSLDLNERDGQGNTALHIAAQHCHWTFLGLFTLYEQHISNNIKNNKGLLAISILDAQLLNKRTTIPKSSFRVMTYRGTIELPAVNIMLRMRE